MRDLALNPSKFTKALRLRTTKEFQQVYQQSRRFPGIEISLLVRTNNFDYPRLGISIAKRQIPKAVMRNRIKRIIRESFRHRQQDLKGLDIIARANNSSNNLSPAILRMRIEQQWEKLIAFYRKS